MEILYDWVSKEGLPEPKWTEDCKQVTIGTVLYSLKDFGMYSNSHLDCHKLLDFI